MDLSLDHITCHVINDVCCIVAGVYCIEFFIL
jgi:hypothetical protein